jgi:tetratricopeptide (TPR) repeat protein
MLTPVWSNSNFSKLLTTILLGLLLGGCGYSDELHQRHTLLKLLWTEQYVELDKSIAQAYVEKDKGKISSNRLRGRFWQLQNADPAFEPRFDHWVDHQKSAYAYLARGLFWLARAEKLRGDNVASNISPDVLAHVRELAQRGVDDLHQALQKDARCAMCVGGEIWANLLLNQRDPELIETALFFDRSLWQPVAAHFISLYPQWGGSEEQMDAFIKKMETQTGQERIVPRLKAMFYFRRGMDQQYNQKNYASAIKEYETAVSYYPDDYALKNLAEMYMWQGDPYKAATALEKNLETNDPWDLYTIEALAQAYFAQGDENKGKKMMMKRDELVTRFHNGE